MPSLFQSLSIYVSFAFNVVLLHGNKHCSNFSLLSQPGSISIQHHCILSLSCLYSLRSPQPTWNLIVKVQASLTRLLEILHSFLENQSKKTVLNSDKISGFFFCLFNSHLLFFIIFFFIG